MPWSRLSTLLSAAALAALAAAAVVTATATAGDGAHLADPPPIDTACDWSVGGPKG